MGYSTAAKDLMLGGITPTLISLHTADPGDTGANEVVGGAYAKVAATFNAASANSRQLSADVTLEVPAGTTITHGGVWAAATYLGSFDIVDEVYASAGQYKVLAASTSLDFT